MIYSFPFSTAPDDFVNTLGIVLQFNGVFRSQPVIIMIENDDILENDETFFGNLEAIDQGVIVAPQRAAITIVEDNADSKWEVLCELWNQMYMYLRSFLWHSQNNGYVKEVVTILHEVWTSFIYFSIAHKAVPWYFAKYYQSVNQPCHRWIN